MNMAKEIVISTSDRKIVQKFPVFQLISKQLSVLVSSNVRIHSSGLTKKDLEEFCMSPLNRLKGVLDPF